MKLKKIFFVSCLSIIMFSSTPWAKPTQFDINVKTGEKYGIHLVRNEDTRITFNSGETKTVEELEMNMNIYIKDIDKGKNVSIDCEYESIRLSKDMFGKKVEYNTENKNISNPLNDIYKEFIGKKFTLSLNNKGKVLNITGINELLTSIADAKATNKEEKLLIKEDLNKKFGEETIKEIIKKTINYYPDKNVEIGEAWETKYDIKEAFLINYSNKFTMLNEKDGIVNIYMNSNLSSNSSDFMGARTNVNMTGEYTGTIEIEKETGIPRNLKFTKTLKGYLSDADSTNVDKIVIPMKITEKLTYEFTKK